MGKLKKSKREEKSKVKLKKTKFLPKGLNVTDTSFKVKSIILPQQLQVKNNSGPLSQRNLTIKELLIRVKHYNSSVKIVGCEGLRDIIANNAELLPGQLSDLFRGVCPLALDRERKVRREAVKVIDLILKLASSDKIAPFFPVISAYFRCAMTDIDKSVQEDSLFYLDAIARNQSELISKNYSLILTDFFTLISKMRSNSKPGRTLTVNLGSKLTSIQWRIKVLSRLHDILKAAERVEKPVITCEKSGFYKKFPPCPINFFQETPSNRDDTSEYLEILVPLLHETWLEVVPSDFKESSLPHDALAVLNCSLNIFYLLWKLAALPHAPKSSVVFIDLLVESFPYQASGGRFDKKIKNILPNVSGQQCLQENLLLCKIFAILNRKLNDKRSIHKAQRVVNYLLECLPKRAREAVPVIRIILLENSENWMKNGVELLPLLKTFLQSLRKIGEDPEVVGLLKEIVHKPLLNSLDEYQKWLKTLSRLLCKGSISEDVLDTLLLLSKQNNRNFQKGVLKNLEAILMNLNAQKAVLKVVAILYYLPKLKEAPIGLLEQFIRDNQGSEAAKHINNMIQLRFDVHICANFESKTGKCGWK